MEHVGVTLSRREGTKEQTAMRSSYGEVVTEEEAQVKGSWEVTSLS
jgi:hypothetical protein